jgi:hypothetical protein
MEFGKVKNVSKSRDPYGNVAAPEVIIDSRRVFDPKDKKVLDENGGIEKE